MGEDKPVPKSESAREHVTFERMDGELDAALVFAVSADYQRQSGNPELAASCMSDAADLYTKVMAALPSANLTDAQLPDLKAKLMRLHHLLNGIPTPRRNEAA